LDECNATAARTRRQAVNGEIAGIEVDRSPAFVATQLCPWGFIVFERLVSLQNFSEAKRKESIEKVVTGYRGSEISAKVVEDEDGFLSRRHACGFLPFSVCRGFNPYF
jgi:hypothetical protein